MVKKVGFVVIALILAMMVLGISLLTTSWSVVRKSYPAIIRDTKLDEAVKEKLINSDSKSYEGQLLPGDYFYPFGVIEDRVGLLFTTNNKQKAERLLSISNKRMGLGLVLLEQEKLDEAWIIMNKSEQYLWLSWEKGKNITELKEKYKEALEIHKAGLTLLQERITDKGVVETLIQKEQVIQEQL